MDSLSSSSSLSMCGIDPTNSNIGLVCMEESFLRIVAPGNRHLHWQEHFIKSVSSSGRSKGKYLRHCGHGKVSSSRGTRSIACSTETNKFWRSSGNSTLSGSSILEASSRSMVEVRVEHMIPSRFCRGFVNSANVWQWISEELRQIKATSKPGALRFLRQM